jgi:hypothetical protein
MTTYIFFDAALRMLVNAYLFSVVLLVGASAIGLAVIETIEKADNELPKSKWFV